MTTNARPNLGGLFNGSTPADRVSSIAGRLGPRLVTAPTGQPDPRVATPTDSKADATDADAAGPSGGQSAGSHRENQATRSTAPADARPIGGADHRNVMGWIDPIRALELYFSVLQAALDVNRQIVMGLAGVLITGGARSGGPGSIDGGPQG